MEPAAGGRYGGFTAKNLTVRLLLLAVFFLVLRFAYVVTIYGDLCDAGGFCFYKTDTHVAISGGVKTGNMAFVRAGNSNPEWSSREWRKAVSYYNGVFQALVMEGFLSPGSRSLCVGSRVGHEVFALKEIGVHDAVGIGKTKSPPLLVASDPLRQPFENGTFDFVFAGVGIIEGSKWPAHLAVELERMLKPGWFLVVHTSSTGDAYSLNSFLGLFPSCSLARSREITGFKSAAVVHEIVLQKHEGGDILGRRGEAEDKTSLSSGAKLKNNKCSISSYKLELLKSAEPLINDEPLKPWITLKRNIQNIKYLPSMADINFKRKYVYIDVGARTYGSSIGSWFRKQYPKQNRTFEIFAIEADKAFYAEYATKKGVKLIPFAAWVRNETLSFEVSHNPDDHDNNEGKGLGMGRISTASGSSSSAHAHSIQGIDFAEWLKNTVSERDFVVMKMDVEGTEFDLIPRLFETGAICLVDELFLECHYNRWQRCCPGERSPKYQKSYGQCLELFSSLRESGVLVHQWW